PAYIVARKRLTATRAGPRTVRDGVPLLRDLRRGGAVKLEDASVRGDGGVRELQAGDLLVLRLPARVVGQTTQRQVRVDPPDRRHSGDRRHGRGGDAPGGTGDLGVQQLPIARDRIGT